MISRLTLSSLVFACAVAAVSATTLTRMAQPQAAFRPSVQTTSIAQQVQLDRVVIVAQRLPAA